MTLLSFGSPFKNIRKNPIDSKSFVHHSLSSLTVSTAFMLLSADEIAAYCEAHAGIGVLCVLHGGETALRYFGEWEWR